VNRALALDPSDIATHLGRMALLVRSNHLEELPRALERSLASYRGPEAYEHWLRVPGEMMLSEEYGIALEMYRLLEPRYRDSPVILGAIGQALRRLQRPDEALPYLFRAIAIEPENPMLHYEIAEAQDLAGADDGAEVQLRKAIDIQPDETRRQEWLCRLGVFLETKRGDRLAACALERTYCTSAVASACAPPEPPTGPSCVLPGPPP
jgi:tetratricopeptide (TPR) repeat protein